MLPFWAIVNLGAMQWIGAPHSPKLQHLWNLTMRSFSVIPRTLVGWGFLPLCRSAVGIFYSSSRLGKSVIKFMMTENCKPCEIYKEAGFSLNNTFSCTKQVCHFMPKTKRQSMAWKGSNLLVKKHVPDVAVNKEGHADILLFWFDCVL